MLLSLANDACQGATDSNFERFRSECVLERLRALDDRVQAEGLAGLDPAAEPLISIGMEGEGGRVIKNGYGVFNLSWQAQRHPEWPDLVAAEVEQIRRGIKEAHRVPLRFLIWAGMGGSAEDKSMYGAAGLLRRGPRCYVLDSADPAKLESILADIEQRHRLPVTTVLRSTLVVGMAMGMTSYEPVLNLEKMAALYERYRIDSRSNFLYLAIPDSLLDRFGCERGYRRVELQLDSGNTTAGRHSGPLTRGSLYPLALAKVDLRAWISGTFLTDEDVATAWRVASFIHAQGEAGRDKLTLLLPKPWLGAGPWTKQDFEESLGKSEHVGLKVIPCPKLRLANYRAPRDPRQDRAFLALQVKGLVGPDSAKLALLRRAGYPVATLALPRGTPLSAYMQLIHYTVFGLAYLRGMNFVTQPGVELYKAISNRIHAEAGPAGGIEHTTAWRSLLGTPRQAEFNHCLRLYYDRLCMEIDPDGRNAPQLYAAILKKLVASGRVEYGELTFFGDMRYRPEGIALRKRLVRCAEELFGARLKMPADVCEGPAMNHSYHEMIIGHGRCFSTVLLLRRQRMFPHAQYTPDYHVAQFLATQAALAERGRPVVALTLEDLSDHSLAALKDFFHQAAKCL